MYSREKLYNGHRFSLNEIDACVYLSPVVTDITFDIIVLDFVNKTYIVFKTQLLFCFQNFS